MEIKITLLSCLCYALVAALPTQKTDTLDTAADAAASAPSLPRFASVASQKIALNMLKFNADIDANQVYSPLGISSILGVLAEGAAGETYDEFSKTLGFPAERADLRTSFQRILSRYQTQEYSTLPSFQTWLYIYRNNSARDEFKQLIRENYFVTVKDINTEEYNWNEPNTSPDVESSSVCNSKDVIGFETLKRLRADADLATAATETQTQTQAQTQTDTYGEEVVDKAASKFDRVVEDKQYVEKPVILEEIKKNDAEKEAVTKQEADKITAEQSKPTETAESTTTIGELIEQLKETEATDIAEIPKQEDALVEKDITKREDDLNFEDNETVHSEEKLQKHYDDDQDGSIPIKEVLDSNEPEKVTLPLQKLESALDTANKNVGEIMIALESHISSVRRALGARSLFRKEDIAHALSANSITGRDAGSKTKMLLFNGLYYAGLWAKTFSPVVSDEDSFFFMTAEDAMKAPMMQTKGKFHVAELDYLNAKAFCLPYENKKYAMMIVLPNETEGLRSLIGKLQPEDLKKAKSLAKEKELRITMPKFQVDETSRSEAMLKSIGLKKLFARQESDLSLFSVDPDLHVDEVVQFVSVRVNESGSSENALTASNPQGRTSEASEVESIVVNRPFLYFIMDCEEEFVIAAGKIYNPEVKEESPISVEVEFEQS
ncbi:serpin B13-like [Rhagoletis pomonella]|uniref:serpin B13-like n=1 Tax=Rhagoletis pomonella TaxID=28610 RepID=UPI0017811703|nr:serpin B13-like [Rhagoletis pomonella]